MSPRNAAQIQNANAAAQQAYSRAQQMQHASIASAQARLNAGQVQNLQSLPAGLLNSAQQMNQPLPQTDFQQGGGDGNSDNAQLSQSQNVNFAGMGNQQEDGQNRGIPSMLPNLTLMTDQQLQAYGVAMNQKFMQFKTRAIQVSKRSP